MHIYSLNNYVPGQLLESYFEEHEVVCFPVISPTIGPWAEMEIVQTEDGWAPARFGGGVLARAIVTTQLTMAQRQRSQGKSVALPDILLRFPQLGASFFFYRENSEEYLVPLALDMTRVDLRTSQFVYPAADVLTALRDTL